MRRCGMNKEISSAALMVLILVAAGGVGTAGFLYVMNYQSYITQQSQYQDLLERYQNLTSAYEILTGDYDILDESLFDYDVLLNEYDTLLERYNTICNYIKMQILPLQMYNWADAVRRTHLQTYLDQSINEKTFYIQYATFCRDLILHASGQLDSYVDVSDAFGPALKYGSDTMELADDSMRVMAHAKDSVWNHFPYRWGWHFTGVDPELYGIDKIVQDCIDNLEYEYDDDITYYQVSPEWEYPKHPVETAFRKMGDCEDQAMMCAAYLERDYFERGVENVYFQTAFCLFHDPQHRDYGEFYHAALIVHIEDTDAYWDEYPSTYLWRFGYNDPFYPDYTWCFVDPTWDTPFGTHPAWLDYYNDEGISYDVFTIALCDVGGDVW